MNLLKNLALTMLVGGAVMGATSGANAVVVFSDNFDSYAPGLNWQPPANWSAPPPGTVDLIGTGTSWDYFPGNGHYVDINGSNGIAGVLATLATFAAGDYLLQFKLGGNSVGPNYGDNASKTTTISLGNWSTAITLAANAPLTLYSFAFTTTSVGALVFAMGSAPPGQNFNIGNILDNVVVSTTPLPPTWAMMIAGFLVLGFFAVRRSKTGADLAAAA